MRLMTGIYYKRSERERDKMKEPVIQENLLKQEVRVIGESEITILIALLSL